MQETLKLSKNPSAVEKRAKAWALELFNKGFSVEVSLKYARRRFGAVSC